ncbi:hypothetical protein VCHA38O206_10200 [Vibrio chagasii]|nr:hypothetical protein VCHA35P150_10577 [Vibrio chagasii]CAH7103108.1 hypothetical protein VCHA38O206_10200 [Vibrio chagasii]
MWWFDNVTLFLFALYLMQNMIPGKYFRDLKLRFDNDCN